MTHETMLAIHVWLGFGGLTLGGVAALLPKFGRYSSWHRWVGRGYLICILGSSGLSVPLAYRVSHVPLFGEARRSAALSEFCRLLSMLVKYEVGLPEAVRLAAGSVRDADLREACFDLATRIQAGESLTDAATQIGRFPQDLLHRGIVQMFQAVGCVYRGHRIVRHGKPTCWR